MLLGIGSVMGSGIWIVRQYESLEAYPSWVFIFFMIGIGLMAMAYFVIEHMRRKDPVHEEQLNQQSEGNTDNRVFINAIWNNREKIGGRALLVCLVILAGSFFYDKHLVAILLEVFIILGSIAVISVYILQSEYDLSSEGSFRPESSKVETFLRLIDYRKHPFSLPLILYILIILSFLLSKQLGIELSLDVGRGRYVISMPVAANMVAISVFGCGLLYIIHNCSIFGIRRAAQADYKVIYLHFFEAMLGGVGLVIWLVTLLITGWDL